jgi:hypothetical protein
MWFALGLLIVYGQFALVLGVLLWREIESYLVRREIRVMCKRFRKFKKEYDASISRRTR